MTLDVRPRKRIGPALLFSVSVTPVELAVMLALQCQLTALPMDVWTITGLLVFAVSLAPRQSFCEARDWIGRRSERIASSLLKP